MGRPKFNLLRDVVSGAIMAATSVPQLIAYAETAGYAGYRGLSTAGPSLLAWGLTTGSPFMTCGVTSITSMTAKTDLDGESFAGGENEYVKLVAMYSFCIGLASIALGLLGFGRLAQSVPKPVRAGFKWGCAAGVMVSAVPNGLFAGGSKELKRYMARSFVQDYMVAIKAAFPGATGAVTVSNFFFGVLHPHLWGVAPAAIFFLCTALVKLGGKRLPAFLPPGTEVILATAAATLYSVYSDYNGAVVGEMPAMDSAAGGGIRLPIEVLDYRTLDWGMLLQRFGGSWVVLAVSSTLFAGVNFLSIMGIAAGFESEDGVPWSAPRELVAQGVACLVAAAVGSAPVSGSMSRSLVSRMTGATSQLACIITALFWIYLLPYMSIMSPTPKAALSAVIVSAVLKTVFVPKDLVQIKGLDALIGWGTGIATALTSPTIGFGLGLALSVVLSFMRSPQDKKKNI